MIFSETRWYETLTDDKWAQVSNSIEDVKAVMKVLRQLQARGEIIVHRSCNCGVCRMGRVLGLDVVGPPLVEEPAEMLEYDEVAP